MSEPIETVAVMAPGDMGHSVGAVLRGRGLRVVTCLAGRSPRTRTLAARAGIEDLGSETAVVAAADMMLSIVVPAGAQGLAERIAVAMRHEGKDLLYVDCNAVAPATAKRVGAVIEAAGGRFVDAGIIGPPPRRDPSATRFYASGRHASSFAALRDFGLDVRVVGEAAGQASAVKMCYAALSKGSAALMTQLSVAAERLGVSATLRQELALSAPGELERMRKMVPAMVPKAHRWVGEMEEIARTFEAAGVAGRTFEGAAEIYAAVAATAIGRLSPEDWAAEERSLASVIDELAKARSGQDPA